MRKGKSKTYPAAMLAYSGAVGFALWPPRGQVQRGLRSSECVTAGQLCGSVSALNSCVLYVFTAFCSGWVGY